MIGNNASDGVRMGRLSFFWFCIRSLGTEYGWDYFRMVLIRHPFRFSRYILSAYKLMKPGTIYKNDSNANNNIETPDVIGLGFCLKPIQPPCPSGRFNHDCEYLSNFCPAQVREESRQIPAACQCCMVRILGESALMSGKAVYIMTSAHDILHDLFLSGKAALGLESGIFVLCRYSMIPFRLAMHMAGIKGIIHPYEEGDCRNYQNWRRADKGDKEERTSINPELTHSINTNFAQADTAGCELLGVRKESNIYLPVIGTTRVAN